MKHTCRKSLVTDSLPLYTPAMRMFRLLHTSDWHLGHVLHEQHRHYEHEVFLNWLLTVLEDEQIDALLVAGDVFDSPNPTPQSQRLFYNFLAAAKARLSTLDAVILGGNHDSAARLNAAHPVLAAFGVHVLGGLPQTDDGVPDPGRCLITLHASNGAPAAHLAAVPYLRPGTLSSLEGGENADQKLAQSIGAIYRLVCQEAIRRAGCEHPSIAAGHLYLSGGRPSEASERKIQNGYLAALPLDVFSPQLSYVALGHLHLGQAVSDNIYYSGSPLPLSFGETDDSRHVLVAEFDGPRLVEVRPVPVPRAVEFVRIPEDGPQPPEQLLADLRRLEKRSGRDPGSPARPYLEARVRLDRPRPTLREEINRELDDKWPRLLKVTPDYGQHTRSSSDPAGRSLNELSHEEIFRHCYRRKYASAESILDEPGERLMQAFRLLWEEHERREAR